jgi:hypothetical protein
VSRVPPHASGSSSPPGVKDLEELEELGDDAIIAQQQGAHVPKPRVQVQEESRSVVISDHPTPGSHPPSGPKIPADPGRRKDRTEKTVVIRDRRQIEELRREMAKRRPVAPPAPAPSQGILLWVIVGIAAFLMGGLVALFATRDETEVPATAAPSASVASPPPAAPPSTAEPPSVSIDELPIEGAKK